MLTAIAWITLGLGVGFGLLWLFQRSLVYLPAGQVPGPPLGVESASYETSDGLVLSGWYLQAHDHAGVVIVFSGNAGHRAHRLPLGESVVAAGYSVLLTDYRGNGDNPGSPSEEGVALDARAAMEYVRDRSPGLPIVYFGESLGAGVAVRLASEEPPDALILRSPWTSLPDVATVHYPFLPVSLLLRDRFPNLELIADIDVPVLVIAGEDDTIIPIEQSREVYDIAKEPKRWLAVEASGHNDRKLLDGEEMIEAIVRFLAGR